MNNDMSSRLENRVADFIDAGLNDDGAFEELALDVFRFQRANNLPYRKYCDHIGATERVVDGWRLIPAVPQSAFKRAALRSFPETETAAVFHTSGTTGEGFGSHYFRSTRLYDAAVLRGWDRLDLPRLPQVIFTLPPDDAPHSSLSHMMGVLKARAANGEQQFCLKKNGVLDSGPLRNSREPLLVIGTALAFWNLFNQGERFALHAGSLAMETGGYKGSRRTLAKAELYALFGEFLGLPASRVLNEYGMTELSSQFYTRGLGRVHRGPPWTRTLVIDPETTAEVALGSMGMLRIFDVANLGSVLAVQTEDLAIRRDEGFELLGRDPAALPRGCSRAADELLVNSANPQ